MAERTPKQLVGVTDGSSVPALKADARQVLATKRVSIMSKVTGTGWASGDTIPLGKKPEGATITDIKLCTGTSLGTSTIDIGDGTTVDKYVDGATLTATDVPTSIGPKASTIDDDPGAEEDLVATVGVATIASGTVLSFIIEFAYLD